MANYTPGKLTNLRSSSKLGGFGETGGSEISTKTSNQGGETLK